jgi:hypothetical protein
VRRDFYCTSDQLVFYDHFLSEIFCNHEKNTIESAAVPITKPVYAIVFDITLLRKERTSTRRSVEKTHARQQLHGLPHD